MGWCTCTQSLYVNRTFLVGVVVDISWTLQLLDLLPLDSQRVSVGVRIRNSAWMKWIVPICAKQIQYIYQYFCQFIQCYVKKHYYSLFNPDIHENLRAVPMAAWFDWRCIILLLSMITCFCSSRRWSAKQNYSPKREKEKYDMWEISMLWVFGLWYLQKWVCTILNSGVLTFLEILKWIILLKSHSPS